MVLEQIIQQKKKEVEFLKEKLKNLSRDTIDNLKNRKNRAFYRVLKNKKPFAVIAECKKASPSLGVIRENYDPLSIAQNYEQLGADAISVLTDENFFQGSIEDLDKISKAVSIPVLRKDFIISKEQILEAKLNGADAILLIVRILKEDEFVKLWEYANELNLDSLVETHNEKEIELALKYPVKVLGINHRDLDTLKINMDLSIQYAPMIKKSYPDVAIIAESGIEEPNKIKELSQYVDGFLIGTYFMKSSNIKEAWKHLFNQNIILR
jgi:indole-3-glycerol phosphate synthase